MKIQLVPNFQLLKKTILKFFDVLLWAKRYLLFVIFTIDSIDFLVYRISEVFEQSMPDPSSGVDDTSPGTVAG
jgi:hypothetical protein